jgi:hypothetical protein
MRKAMNVYSKFLKTLKHKKDKKWTPAYKYYYLVEWQYL